MRYVCLHRQEFHLGAYSLVPLRYQDRFSIMRWRNEQIYHLRQQRPLTEEDQQKYFDTVVSRLFDQPSPDQILFSYLEDGQCIGYGGLVHINWTDRVAEVSFIMDTSREAGEFALHWTNYLTMLQEVAFGNLQLHKLFTYAFDLRPHLYPVLESFGFVREATLKEHCLYQGQYKDVVIHSLWAYNVVNYTKCSPVQLEEILALRNREDIRRWMVTPEPIPLENHLAFVRGLNDNSDHLYYAVYKSGVLVGTYNLTRGEDGVWERGIIAVPAVQGKGETARWERQIIASLPADVKALSAKVKQDNQRSVRYHEKMGFQEQSRDAEYIYYLLTL
ncbi:MAG: GNAT family N-acetyltransferase [Bacteroidales bacterium]|nr:GNAT family N-acetyltransferase [Bacteroidales bacterium]